jgi:hypothetical protein
MANATVLEFVSSQAPGSSGSVGTERRSSNTIRVNKIEKIIPAIAAAFGVLRLVRVSVSLLGNMESPSLWEQQQMRRTEAIWARPWEVEAKMV